MPSVLWKPRRYRLPARLCPIGLPTYGPIASGPWASRIGDEQALDLGECLVPADRLVGAVRPAYVRLPEPVGVVMQVLMLAPLGQM